ncbi:unnamed protein product [Pseudo-nitzschia multistriata]|uniref:Uncharacterized protein n=1 Tax=Pseudo-nitzschia multistriata TaxID=183589 RepID=A0A448YYL5_9STRA|nr:unnamed protein product [Pseudo-nitzschia multistriata]
MEASSRSILVEDVNDGDEDTFGVETDTEADFDFDEPEEITDDFLDELSPYASTTNFDFGASATSAAFENYNMSGAGTALVDNNASTDFDFLSDPVPGGTENGNGPAAGLEAPSAAGGGDNALDAFGDGIGDAATPDAAPVGRGLFGTLGRMGRMVVNGAGGGRSANDQSPPDLLDMDSGADDPNGTTGQQFQVDLAGGMAVQSDSTDNGSNDVDPFDGTAAGETGEPQTPSGGGLFGTLGRMGRMVVNSAGKTNGNDDDPTPHDLLDDDGGFPPDRFDDEAEQQQGGPEGSAGADSDAPTQQAAGGLFGTLGRMGGRVGGRIFRSRSPEQVDPSGDNDLDADGNSLPHPGSLENNNSNVANPMGDSGDLSNLGGQGNSLPHPEALMRQSNAAPPAADTGNVSGNNDDAILDVNGNSLPHPDAMNPDSLAISKEDENLDILHGVGNSLPHPEALMRQSNSSARDFGNNDGENDDAILDVDGNSLPHPDTMKSKNGEEDLENLDGNGNSLPHPETLMRKAKAASPDNGNEDGNNDAILDENGNSLPHPDAMKSKNVANGKGEEDLENLDGNGNSLPHPETLKENYPVTMLQKIRAFAAGESGDNDESILDENGSSLPNPDVMKSRSGSNSEEDEDLENLDGNGNSLPHPDTLMRQSKDKAVAATREICADGYNDNDNASENGDIILDDNGNSLPHPDTLRGMTSTDNLLADIESATNAQDNKSSNNNVDDCSSNGEDRLDCGGNSLPHPDTIKASATSVRRRTASSLFGNIRRSVMSTLPGISILNYSEIETPTSQDQDDFRDEENAVDDMNAVASRSTLDAALLRQSDENRNALQHSGASFRDSSSRSIFTIDDSIESNFISDSNSLSTFGGMSRMSIGRSTGKLLDANGSSLPSQEEGASSGSASKHSSRRLRELGQSFLSTLNARASSSSLRSNGAAQREQEEFNFEDNAYIEGDAGIDEEYGRKSGTWHSNRDVEFDNNGFPVAYRVDRFDDERSRGEKDSSNSSRKERIQKLFKEQTERFQDQRYSWRLGCLLFAVFLIFLGMLIPLITLARERRQRIAVTAPPVATAPTESPIIETIGYDVDCDDEIDLVDENGKKVGDESNSIVTLSGNSDIVACYTTEQPIMFRFKRCRPSSLDFTGVFPLGSLFMDQLWQPYYAASYLCGEQPCPSGGANPPITKVMTGPPIAKPGDYRIFLVKESLWPYEYSVYTPLFRVVEDGQECPIPDDQIVTPVPVN